MDAKFYANVDDAIISEGADEAREVRVGVTRGRWGKPITFYRLLKDGKEIGKLHPVDCYGLQFVKA